MSDVEKAMRELTEALALSAEKFAKVMGELAKALNPESEVAHVPLDPGENTVELPLAGQPLLVWDPTKTQKPPLTGVGQVVYVNSRRKPELGLVKYRVFAVTKGGCARLERLDDDEA
jgi:hypothetical protein